MSDPTSRYDRLPTTLHVDADGHAVLFRTRRFLPQVRSGATDVGIVVRVGDRLDSVAARALGDPMQFWRIADANAAMNPLQLPVPGAVLRIPNLGGGSEP